MNSTTRCSTGARPRWCVALLGLSDESSAAVKTAVAAAGGSVVLEGPARIEGATRSALAAADALLVRFSAAGARAADLASFTSLGRPVVMLSRDTTRATSRRAVRAGVAAFLAEPLRIAQLAPTLDLAIARYGDAEMLRRKLADRKVIERAKGRVMALAGVTEDDAYRWLRTRAMDTRAGLAEVARTVLDSDGVEFDFAAALHRPRVHAHAATLMSP